MTWQTNLRSRDLAKIGQIVYPQRSFKRLGIVILWYQSGKISQKTQGGVGFKRFLTFDLYLGQVKGQGRISYIKMFRAGSQVSWYEWILPISSWDFTIRTFICPFFSTFSVIIQWQHDIFCHTSWYELLGIWPLCPPSFIEISWKMSEFWPQFNYYCGDYNYY